MTQKGKPTKFYFLFILGMFAAIYLLKYAANSRDLTAGYFVDGFLRTLLLLITLNYHFYLSDRSSTLPKNEFKAVRRKSIFIVFFSVWIITSGVSIIEKILLHTELNWMKTIAFGCGCALISVLIAIIMSKLVPIKITSKSTPNLRQ